MQTEDIALTLVAGLGTKGAVHLLQLFGSAERIFQASADELAVRAQLRDDIIRNILSRNAFAAAEREIAHCRRHGIKAIASTDAEYPQLLLETDDYPHVIYLCGEVEALARRSITFVGTRRMTPYGERACNTLIAGLAERIPDLCIVSGLAYGVDAAAHRAAMLNGLPTIAVVANALPEVTPTAHTALARDIISRGGAVITELHSQTRQNGGYFISRNRIMAAASHATVVVESAAGGGSLATAAFADGYNRPVLAVPGRITDQFSAGTNLLIRNRKAQAVLSAEDIVSELMWDLSLPPRASSQQNDAEILDSLLPVERQLLDCFGNADEASVAELAERSGLATGELAAHLMSMEISGAVRQLPGNIFQKLINTR